MSANARQVGGGHYKTEGVQHWDVMEFFDVPYLEGNATKYLCRWHKKNGRQDLEKAQHYVQKLIESAQRAPGRRAPSVQYDAVAQLVRSCGCNDLTSQVIHLLLNWKSVSCLLSADLLLLAVQHEHEVAQRARIPAGRDGEPYPRGFDPAQDVQS